MKKTNTVPSDSCIFHRNLSRNCVVIVTKSVQESVPKMYQKLPDVPNPQNTFVFKSFSAYQNVPKCTKSVPACTKHVPTCTNRVPKMYQTCTNMYQPRNNMYQQCTGCTNRVPYVPNMFSTIQQKKDTSYDVCNQTKKRNQTNATNWTQRNERDTHPTKLTQRHEC